MITNASFAFYPADVYLYSRLIVFNLNFKAIHDYIQWLI